MHQKSLVEKNKEQFQQEGTLQEKQKPFLSKYSMLDNVQMLSNFISGKNKKLEFSVPNMPIENNFDFKKIKQNLIQLTPEKRKELGINKSTLWYLKKGLESGKKPRIYKKVLEKVELV